MPQAILLEFILLIALPASHCPTGLLAGSAVRAAFVELHAASPDLALARVLKERVPVAPVLLGAGLHAVLIAVYKLGSHDGRVEALAGYSTLETWR